MIGKISEIFYSIQGEGIYQGMPQMFVRFWGCNLNCCFCDTKFVEYRQMSHKQVIEALFSQKASWDSVAFTGGEPLMQVEFLKELCRNVKNKDKSVYLETNGVLFSQLIQVIDDVDIIAMDFKLPSSTKDESFWDAHYKFLKEADKKEVFVKAVITPFTVLGDIERSISLIAKVNPNIFFVLQPVFSYEAFLWDKLEKFKNKALEALPNVRILSQLHKYIGVR